MSKITTILAIPNNKVKAVVGNQISTIFGTSIIKTSLPIALTLNKMRSVGLGGFLTDLLHTGNSPKIHFKALVSNYKASCVTRLIKVLAMPNLVSSDLHLKRIERGWSMPLVARLEFLGVKIKFLSICLGVNPYRCRGVKVSLCN